MEENEKNEKMLVSSPAAPLKKVSGDEDEEKFEEEVLEVRRVTKVTEGGKKLHFRVGVALGNKRGKIGLGIAKALEVPQALDKARAKAMKNLIEVPIVEETIPFEIKTKFKTVEIFLKPASKGTGLIAGRLIRPLIELAGIKNILSKVRGSNDKLVNAYATLKAFGLLSKYYQKLKKIDKKK